MNVCLCSVPSLFFKKEEYSKREKEREKSIIPSAIMFVAVVGINTFFIVNTMFEKRTSQLTICVSFLLRRDV